LLNTNSSRFGWGNRDLDAEQELAITSDISLEEAWRLVSLEPLNLISFTLGFPLIFLPHFFLFFVDLSHPLNLFGIPFGHLFGNIVLHDILEVWSRILTALLILHQGDLILWVLSSQPIKLGSLLGIPLVDLWLEGALCLLSAVPLLLFDYCHSLLS
jgi:hypothetical protein